ncbi:hypothetical protein IGI04_019298 [Brassica rapa subsp. trilocularis]|uniref:Uncharacterized protein n=1 Tax=Brassica rapa subsp. trilocularis TaxID=1813537 RepID=A0ABQ7MIT1_BRACM|nr:hypothetical protein IGI04_019298 [Brassica rapa subsp. trilocularis]
MCLPISYPEDRKDVGELEKLLRSDLPDAKRMYRRCTQEKRPSLSQEWPVVRGMDQGVGAVVLLVQETHKEGHHLSHEETGGPKTLELKANGDPVGLSADVGIVVLLEDGELVGLSADVGIVVLPVQNSLKLTFKLVTILMSHFLIEDQQEVGELKEDLSDQSEKAVTPHCSYQPDARIIQSGTFLAKQSHDGGKLWSCKVPLHVEPSREQCKGWLREGMAWRIQKSFVSTPKWRQEARRKGETSSGHKKKLKGDLTVKQLAPIQVVHCLTSDQKWSLQVVDSLLHYSVPTGSKKLSSKCTKISLSLTEDDDDDPVVS